MTMLPITIDELRADHGPSPAISDPPTFEQIGRQRAQFTASLQSLQQFTVETGKGGYVVEYQEPTDDELVDRIDELETKNFGIEERVVSLKAQLQHFVDKWAETEGNETVLKAQVDRQADTIKRLHAQVDVLRAQNRSLTDRCLGLEGKRPAPGGALDDAPGAGFEMTRYLSRLPAASPLLVDKATGEIRHVSILTGLPIGGPRVPRHIEDPVSQ